MRRVRRRRGSSAPAHGIKLPHEARITSPGPRRGHLLKTEISPQSACVAKGGNAALGAHSGAGEDKKTIAQTDFEHAIGIVPRGAAQVSACGLPLSSKRNRRYRAGFREPKLRRYILPETIKLRKARH